MANIHIPVSIGELVDKITILEIKRNKITDATKLRNVQRELDLLEHIWRFSKLDRALIDSEWLHRSRLHKQNTDLRLQRR